MFSKVKKIYAWFIIITTMICAALVYEAEHNIENYVIELKNWFNPESLDLFLTNEWNNNLSFVYKNPSEVLNEFKNNNPELGYFLEKYNISNPLPPVLLVRSSNPVAINDLITQARADKYSSLINQKELVPIDEISLQIAKITNLTYMLIGIFALSWLILILKKK